MTNQAIQFGNFTKLNFQPKNHNAQRLLTQYNDQLDIFTQAKMGEQHALTSADSSAQGDVSNLAKIREEAQTKLFALQTMLNNEVRNNSDKPENKDKQKVEDKGFSALG